jgi:integrase
MHEVELLDGSKVRQCFFSPHSLRATAATLLLDSGVPIEAVQDLLDHTGGAVRNLQRCTRPLQAGSKSF